MDNFTSHMDKAIDKALINKGFSNTFANSHCPYFVHRCFYKNIIIIFINFMKKKVDLKELNMINYNF